MSNDIDALIEGAGAPALKFPTIGTQHVGTVISADTRQARDFRTGEGKVFKDGNPIMELVVTLQTDQRDGGPQSLDDGVRRLFCNRRMLQAIRDALKDAGGVKLRPGGRLAIAYTGDGQAEGPGLSPPKLFKAKYQPGAEPTVDQLVNQATPVGDTGADWEPF